MGLRTVAFSQIEFAKTVKICADFSRIHRRKQEILLVPFPQFAPTKVALHAHKQWNPYTQQAIESPWMEKKEAIGNTETGGHDERMAETVCTYCGRAEPRAAAASVGVTHPSHFHCPLRTIIALASPFASSSRDAIRVCGVSWFNV